MRSLDSIPSFNLINLPLFLSPGNPICRLGGVLPRAHHIPRQLEASPARGALRVARRAAQRPHLPHGSAGGPATAGVGHVRAAGAIPTAVAAFRARGLRSSTVATESGCPTWMWVSPGPSGCNFCCWLVGSPGLLDHEAPPQTCHRPVRAKQKATLFPHFVNMLTPPPPPTSQKAPPNLALTCCSHQSSDQIAGGGGEGEGCFDRHPGHPSSPRQV